MSSNLIGHYLIDSFRLPFISIGSISEENKRGSISGVKRGHSSNEVQQITIDLGVAQQSAALNIEEAATQLARPFRERTEMIHAIAAGRLLEVVLNVKTYDLVQAFSPHVRVGGLDKLIQAVLMHIEEHRSQLVEGIICCSEETQCYILVQNRVITLVIQGYKIELNRSDACIEDALLGINFHDKVDELSAGFSGSISSEKLYEALVVAAFFLNTKRDFSYPVPGNSNLKVIGREGTISFQFKGTSVGLHEQFIGRNILDGMNFISQAKLIAGTLDSFYNVGSEDLVKVLRTLDKQGNCLTELGVYAGQCLQPFQGSDINVSWDNGIYYIGYGNLAVSIDDGSLRLNPLLFPPKELDPIIQKLVRAFPREAGILDQGRLKRILSSFSFDHPDLSNQKPKITLDHDKGHLIFKIKGYSVKLQDCVLGLNYQALQEHGYSRDQIQKAEVFFRRYSIGRAGVYNFAHDLHRILGTSVQVISPAHIMLATGKKLGNGSFKTVYKVINLVTGKPYAWYEFQLQHLSLEEGVRASNLDACEVREMESKRPGCIRSIGVVERPLTNAAGVVNGVAVNVFMKMYDSDLFDLSINTDLSKEVKLSLSRQIAQTLLGYHRDGKAYCDLKLEQILVKRSKEEGLYGFKAVLGDLGGVINSRPDSKGKIKPGAITPAYLSPEVAALIHKERKTETSWIDYQAFDVWTFGALLYQFYLNRSFNEEGGKRLSVELCQRLSAPFPINYYDLAIKYPGIHAIISHILVPAAARWTMERVVAELSRSELLSELGVASSADHRFASLPGGVSAESKLLEGLMPNGLAEVPVRSFQRDPGKVVEVLDAYKVATSSLERLSSFLIPTGREVGFSTAHKVFAPVPGLSRACMSPVRAPASRFLVLPEHSPELAGVFKDALRPFSGALSSVEENLLEDVLDFTQTNGACRGPLCFDEAERSSASFEGALATLG